MTTRRKVLKALGLAVLAPEGLAAQDRPQLKRSRWDMLFGGGEALPSPEVPEPRTWSNDTLTAAWIGHATVLVNFYGTWIITDPVLSTRIGIRFPGLGTLGPKRLVLPALSFEELPPIDLILVSHAHMDHLDLATLAKFDRNIPLAMAKHTSDVIENLAFRDVREVDWGEKVAAAGIEVEGLRVKHFGWRYPWEDDRSRGVWEGRSFNAFLLTKNGKHIVFGGDTAMHEHFRALGERNIDIDLAIMPIGAYDPWVENHANPEEALTLAGHMRARHFLPIHWGTFLQSDEPTNEPIERLRKALAHSPGYLCLDTHGQTWTLPRS